MLSQVEARCEALPQLAHSTEPLTREEIERMERYRRTDVPAIYCDAKEESTEEPGHGLSSHYQSLLADFEEAMKEVRPLALRVTPFSDHSLTYSTMCV